MTTAAKLSPLTPKPDHVPDALVYDFDLYADPGMIKNAHTRVLEVIKESPPVFWTPRNGGQWILRGHAAVFNASRDTDGFSNARVPYEEIQAMIAAMPEGMPKPLIPAPITYDPPQHAIYRLPLQKAFSPKAMAALKDDIRALAIEFIDAVKADGKCEFMETIGEPMPVTVFLKMFGLPVERQKEYRALVKEHLSSNDFDPQATQVRLRKVTAIMHDSIMERRDNPQNDIISMLWQSTFEGRPATLLDLENYCVMLFLAGLDTVMNGMGLGAIHLASNPALQAQLRADPALVAEASEEILRRYTFTLPPRFVNKDMEFEGVAMKKGEMAVLFLPAADLDPTEFPNPAEYSLDRESKTHIAFGAGPHRCLGSHLARLELQILYEEMLARLPEFRLDPAYSIQYHGGPVWGPEQVHLVW